MQPVWIRRSASRVENPPHHLISLLILKPTVSLTVPTYMFFLRIVAHRLRVLEIATLVHLAWNLLESQHHWQRSQNPGGRLTGRGG